MPSQAGLLFQFARSSSYHDRAPLHRLFACLPNGSRWLEQFGFSSGIPSGLGLYDCSFLVGPSIPASTISLIILPALATELQHHPDECFSRYLLSGFTDGFQVGFQPPLVPQLHLASSNMRSALQNPQVVNSYLAR